MEHRKTPIGALWALLASLIFSVNDMLIKLLSDGYALHQIVFTRSLTGVLLLMIVIIPFSGGYGALRTQRLGLHLVRALFVDITGGGLLENIPRVLPDNTKAVINTQAWTRPAVFDWLQKGGNIDEHEMHRTLNCGVGMVICVPADRAQEALDMLAASGETAFELGNISAQEAGEEQVQLLGLS